MARKSAICIAVKLIWSYSGAVDNGNSGDIHHSRLALSA